MHCKVREDYVEPSYIHPHSAGMQAMGFKIMKVLFPSLEAECKAGDMACIVYYFN